MQSPEPFDPQTPDAVGVPRRFGMGRLLALVTFFAVLFSILRVLRTGGLVLALVGVFFLAVGLGQTILYRGRRPRAASCMTGAVMLPILFVIGMLTVFALDLSGGFEAIPGRSIAQVVCAAIYLPPVGAGLGYLTGGLVAGLFLVLDRQWDVGAHRSPHPPVRRGIPWRRRLARIRNYPGRTAWRCFALIILLHAPLTPMMPYPWWWHLVGSLVLATVLPFVVTGVALAGWRSLLAVTLLGFLAPVAPVLIAQSLYINLEERVATWAPPLLTIAVLGTTISLILLVPLGWLRNWLRHRASQRRTRTTVVLIVIAAVCLSVASGISSVILFRLRQRPFQRQMVIVGELRERLCRYPESVNPCEVSLNGVTVTDADLSRLALLPNLRRISLRDTSTDDVGLSYLKDLRNLDGLQLAKTNITNAGLAHLSGLKELADLDLSNTHVTDAGLANLRGMKKLWALCLSNTRVTDAGLRHLQGLTVLKWLALDDTDITDAGLMHLRASKGLMQLDASRTRVTVPGRG